MAPPKPLVTPVAALRRARQGSGRPGRGFGVASLPTVMVQPEVPHHDSVASGSFGRLNLLVTDGGWREESWADRLPRLLEPMGISAVRAGCGREAAAVLERTRVHAAILDLSLPLDARLRSQTPTSAACGLDEGGVRLLEFMARLSPRPPLVIVRQPRSVREDARTLALAMKLGAFAVVDRPVDLERMLQVLGRLIDRCYRGRWPGV